MDDAPEQSSMSDRAPMPDQAPIDVDLIADLACPWCYLGLVRLDRARAMRPDRPVRLRWWPFLLNPQLPPEGMDRAAYLRTKFGGDASARQIYQRIVESAREDGLELAFERMTRTPNTVLAQRLILFAEQHGRAEALIRVLFRALFQEGRDIGDPETLQELAESAGLDRAETGRLLGGQALAKDVVVAHQRAERLGVRGVPVFVVDREQAISGAQPPEVLAGLIDVATAARQAPAAG
ncbi:MAG: DsbA family oxidoreductase [Geminicoccales bacterium]